MRAGLIKIIAEKKKIPMKQLAKLAGISEQQIHLIVRSGKTKIETLEKISEALGVDIKVFFDQKPEDEKNEELQKELLMAYREIQDLRLQIKRTEDFCNKKESENKKK